MGGLGNQLYQYALFLRLLKEDNDSGIDISWYDTHLCHNGFELPTLTDNSFVIANDKDAFFSGDKNVIYKQGNVILKLYYKLFLKNKKYSKTLPQEAITFYKDFLDSRYSYYDGYWTSEKYFKDIAVELRNKLKFPPIDRKNEKIISFIGESNSVSIHIRRGDYLSAENVIYQNVCTRIYYKNAIDYINTNILNPRFFVFSNDIEWCRKNLDLNDAYYIDWNKGRDSYRDMQLMSLCKHNIIANSTFSWWGAWLNQNPNKMVLAPSKWFDLSDCPMEDIYPDEWIKIPIE